MGEHTSIDVALLCVLACSCGGSSLAQREATNTSPPLAPAAPDRCNGSRTAAAEPPTAAESNCQPFLREKLTATEAKLRQVYKPIYGDSRVIVDFPCDPVEQVSQIDIELGDRRSRKLTLLRFTRSADSGAYHVIGIEVLGPDAVEQAKDSRPAEQLEAKTVALDLAATALDVEDVRTPLMATINEVRFKDRLPSVDGFTGPDIRCLVRVDGSNRHLVRRPDGELEQAVELSRTHF